MKTNTNKYVPLQDESEQEIQKPSLCDMKCRMKPSCRVLHLSACAHPHARTFVLTRPRARGPGPTGSHPPPCCASLVPWVVLQGPPGWTSLVTGAGHRTTVLFCLLVQTTPLDLEFGDEFQGMAFGYSLGCLSKYRYRMTFSTGQ